MPPPYRPYSEELNYAERINIARSSVLSTGTVARALHVSGATAAKVIDTAHAKMPGQRQLTRSKLLEYMQESGMDVCSVLPATLIIDPLAQESIEHMQGSLRIQCTSLFSAGMHMAQHAVTDIVIPRPALYDAFAPRILAACERHAYPSPLIHTVAEGSNSEGVVDASA